MKNITVGSWMLLYDDISEQNVMVKILDKDDASKTATVKMDLAVRKTDKPEEYIATVRYDDLRQPHLKVKQKRTA